MRLERVREPGDLAARARQAASRRRFAGRRWRRWNRQRGGQRGGSTGTHAWRPADGHAQSLRQGRRVPAGSRRASERSWPGTVRHVDVGEVNGRIFVNNSSVGLYPRMVWEREAEQRRGHRKWTAFGDRHAATHGATIDADLRASMWTARRAVVRTPFIFVGNNQYTAEGFQLGGRSRLDAGTAVDLRRRLSADASRSSRLPVRALTGRLQRRCPAVPGVPGGHRSRLTCASAAVSVATRWRGGDACVAAGLPHPSTRARRHRRRGAGTLGARRCASSFISRTFTSAASIRRQCSRSARRSRV